jgi:hypothetical protein
MMAMFFGTGIIGIIVGLSSSQQTTLFVTFLGVINLSLGAFFGWIFLTQTPESDDKRKKKRNDN